METLGALIDKLTIIKLKQAHTPPMEKEKNESLASQELQLRTEINQYVADAISGKIPIDTIYQPSHKVHTGVTVPNEIYVSIGGTVAMLAVANCDVWHMQEKVYDFRKVPPALKDEVIEQLAVMNLKRSRCIEEIDRKFKEMLTK